MAHEHELFKLAENEVAFAVKKNAQVNDGWLVFNKATGVAVAYISENGKRKNYSE
jgi:hypothetical protein